MFKKCAGTRRDELQGRVTRVVWGLLLITMGTLFTLDRLGKIDMAPAPYPAANAVDGKADTRWSSEFSDPQWITVDLGRPTEITRVSLHWEVAYSSAYEIQLSDDGASWRTVVSVTKGDGGADEHAVSAAGRYVRVFSTKRGTDFGHSLWELEVYGPGGLLSQGRPVTVSSLEPANYWQIYWPLLLVASGLPLLLVPRDSGSQAMGLGMTVVGAFLQAQSLHLTSWSLKEVVPVLLIAMGALLLLRSVQGQTEPESGSGSGGQG